MMMIGRYPLEWPEGWPRNKRRELSRFGTTQERAQRNLEHQIRLLGGQEAILSTDIRLRNDGMPYASQRPPDDVGIAVYFTYKGKSMVFACDRYTRIQDNIHAVGKTIEALRGIERWGASDMMERAFTGFERLTGPDLDLPWWDVLEMGNNRDLDVAERHFKILAKGAHPDAGGDPEEFKRLVRARDQAREALG